MLRANAAARERACAIFARCFKSPHVNEANAMFTYTRACSRRKEKRCARITSKPAILRPPSKQLAEQKKKSSCDRRSFSHHCVRTFFSGRQTKSEPRCCVDRPYQGAGERRLRSAVAQPMPPPLRYRQCARRDGPHKKSPLFVRHQENSTFRKSFFCLLVNGRKIFHLNRLIILKSAKYLRG